MISAASITIVDSPPLPGLSGRAVPRAGLTGVEIDSMYRILDDNFHGVETATFQRDLAEKNWVILLEDGHGALKGFSTFLMYHTQACGRPMVIVCSGDTIIEPGSWGTSALPRAWIRSVYEARRGYPEGDLYWLLLTSGFRTYRFMPVFCRDFHPTYAKPAQPESQRMLDILCAERFGSLYDRGSGIVRFPKPQTLKERLSRVPEGRHADPHVRFFLEMNSGHAAGDELVSLASLAHDNLTPAGMRMLR